MLNKMNGNILTNSMKCQISLVAKTATARYRVDHRFMFSIMCPDFDWNSAFIRSWIAPVMPSMVSESSWTSGWSRENDRAVD